MSLVRKSDKAFSSGAKEQGFTLIETFIIITLIALFMTAFFNMEKVVRTENKIQQSKGTVKDYATLLQKFGAANGYFPKPAAPNKAWNVTGAFMPIKAGSETPASCTTAGVAGIGGVVCRPFSSSDSTVARRVYIGALPVAALGLTPEQGLDEWGHKYTYVVLVDLTNSATFPSTANVLTIKDQNSATKVTSQGFVIVAHGPNGAGAWDRLGNLITTPTCTGKEALNCYNPTKNSNAGTFTEWWDGKNVDGVMLPTESSGTIPFDDRLAYATSSSVDAWVPKSDNNVYFTANRYIGIGVTNTAIPSSTVQIAQGNARADKLVTPQVCKGADCIKTADVVNTDNASNDNLKCGSGVALTGVNPQSATTKKGCLAVVTTNKVTTDCSTKHGAKGVDATGNIICVDP